MSREGAFFLACAAFALGAWLGGRGPASQTCPPEEFIDLRAELRLVEERLESSERLREAVVEDVLRQKLAPRMLARAVRRTP